MKEIIGLCVKKYLQTFLFAVGFSFFINFMSMLILVLVQDIPNDSASQATNHVEVVIGILITTLVVLFTYVLFSIRYGNSATNRNAKSISFLLVTIFISFLLNEAVLLHLAYRIEEVYYVFFVKGGYLRIIWVWFTPLLTANTFLSCLIIFVLRRRNSGNEFGAQEFGGRNWSEPLD